MSVPIKKTAVSLAIPKYLIRLIHLEARAVFFISLLTVCRDSYVRGVRTAGAQRGETLRYLSASPHFFNPLFLDLDITAIFDLARFFGLLSL